MIRLRRDGAKMEENLVHPHSRSSHLRFNLRKCRLTKVIQFWKFYKRKKRKRKIRRSKMRQMQAWRERRKSFRNENFLFILRDEKEATGWTQSGIKIVCGYAKRRRRENVRIFKKKLTSFLTRLMFPPRFFFFFPFFFFFGKKRKTKHQTIRPHQSAGGKFVHS